ncbi:restriction endonuclease subunit S [Pseudoalteromonas piscicida]|uniref:restriction endonuclease subunit S n=1 Tax=Pseudoalteromonas piscicida TaxID=43662 RepID=UPI0027E488D4|nr:restriction endonuclease subunit S [Pseudoalteromonas piscicida]WMO14505.1 restriction endonuclease subunit S [Pseudoalteromonas piscicida]
MVPNGWNTLALSEITKEKISYGIVQAGPHVDDGIPYIKSADVGGEIDVDSLQRTAKEIHHKYRRSSVHPDDIVFSLRGNIARTSIVPTSLQEANLTQGTARISVNDKNDTKFIYYKLASTPILNRINALSKGSTFKEISLEELRKVKLPLPPLEEQRKIAKILSTWDKAISTTERLIDNSKQQKKALMQQLLTAKKRLLDDSGKPFEGEWEEVKLSNVAEVVMGSSPKSASYNDNSEGLPLIQGNADIKNRKSVPRTYTSEVTKKCRIGDILLSVRAPVGTIAKSEHEACIGRGISAISTKKHHVQEYLYQWLLWFEPRWEKYSQGSTFEAVNSNDIKSLHLTVPSHSEQVKISAVLSNADQEIELLERQLADLKQEKKALMQQMLTGKRRVKI